MSEALIQACKQRWLDFYDLSSSQRRMAIIRFAPDLPPRLLPNPELKRERIEWIWQNYTYHCQRMQWLADDTLPCLDMLTGTEIFAEAFGCQIYRPADNNPFALPCVQNAREAEKLSIPSLDAPPLALAFEMADELFQRAGLGALFRLVDLQSPMDVAALIWEKKDFYTALLESPAAVLALTQKVKTLQFAFLDEWFRRYGRELVAHFPDYYLPQGVTLSVDEIGAVSGRMFQQFFMDDLNDFSSRYNGLGMHCCAHARHQWEHLKKIAGLRLLNISNQGSLVREAYAYFSDVVCQWHYDQSPEPLSPLDWLPEIPFRAHCVVEMTAESREQALHISEQLLHINT